MTRIPKKILAQILLLPEYKICMRYSLFDHACAGRITFEHALTYKGRQIQEVWAILSICACGHGVDGYQDRGNLIKEIHEWIALSRATLEELAKYPKANFEKKLQYLTKKYGKYEQKFPPWYAPSEINYGDLTYTQNDC